MSTVTTLAECQVTAFHTIRIELVENNETAVVTVRWPRTPSVIHPGRFPDTAAIIARAMATASVTLAGIKARKPL